jgi:hypothetical protein
MRREARRSASACGSTKLALPLPSIWCNEILILNGALWGEALPRRQARRRQWPRVSNAATANRRSLRLKSPSLRRQHRHLPSRRPSRANSPGTIGFSWWLSPPGRDKKVFRPVRDRLAVLWGTPNSPEFRQKQRLALSARRLSRWAGALHDVRKARVSGLQRCRRSICRALSAFSRSSSRNGVRRIGRSSKRAGIACRGLLDVRRNGT